MQSTDISPAIGVIASNLVDGGPRVVILLLVIFLAGMTWDRRRVLSETNARVARLERLLEDDREAYAQLAVAMTNVRTALDLVADRLAELKSSTPSRRHNDGPVCGRCQALPWDHAD